ncbi:hypothetical protein BLNAU_22897 [Blattamonas nauphoetae]|uniref:Uncharacterized protein n=1 Tax=Blattamonas nauphoetae TaxID=2049346 RepID=A0ABQ9WSW4_9EUKA|nr:hypothetical protein BLNAU_22897 [Blattamonas nauphoetae]
MCFVMNKIAISILDTQDILTVLNTFSFQRPFPQLRKAQCFPPSQAVKKRSEIKLGVLCPLIFASLWTSLSQHICILVDQAPLPHVFTPLSPNLAFPLPSEYDWRLVNVNDNPTFPSDKDLKTRDEPAFRANNNKKVVLCGHNTYIFAVITSGAPFGGAPMADGSIHNQYSDARLRLSALDDPQQEHIRRRLRRCPAQILSPPPLQHILPSPTLPLSHLSACKGDNVCKIFMKNMTWTDNKAGKACVKTAVQRTRNNTDQPLVLPKVMTHVMYSIGINATAGVILNATSQRWSSDTHSDYYMDGDGTVPTVSLSSILQDAVPIARILDIIAQATAEEMEYDDSLNPPDIFLAVYVLSPHLYPTAFTILYLQRVPCFLLNTGPTWCLDYCGETYLDSIQSHRILILRHEGRSILILRVILHLLMDNTSNQSESQSSCC